MSASVSAILSAYEIPHKDKQCAGSTKAVSAGRTDADINLPILQLDLHLPCSAWAFDQLKGRSGIFGVELEEG
jgi:hypothetical protein